MTMPLRMVIMTRRVSVSMVVTSFGRVRLGALFVSASFTVGVVIARTRSQSQREREGANNRFRRNA